MNTFYETWILMRQCKIVIGYWEILKTKIILFILLTYDFASNMAVKDMHINACHVSYTIEIPIKWVQKSIHEVNNLKYLFCPLLYLNLLCI